MAGIVQWGVDQLFAAMNAIQDGAREQANATADNRARVLALQKRWGSFIGPPAPGALEALASASQRQSKIESVYRSAAAKIADFVAKSNAWLQAHGVKPSGMSGLGQIPFLVPIAVVTVGAVALAAIAWLRDANSAQSKSLAIQEQAFHSVTGGQITMAQYREVVANAEKEASRSTPARDPFGVTNVLEAAMPLALVIAAIIFLPPLFKAMRSRRTA